MVLLEEAPVVSPVAAAVVAVASVVVVAAVEVSAVVETVNILSLISYLGFDQGPPEYVEAVAEFSHACEGMLICNVLGGNVPLLMRSIYL